jgi:hypothetical protein
MSTVSVDPGRWWDGPWWAVIKDARRHQRRRHLRAGIALAAFAAAVVGWSLIGNPGESQPRQPTPAGTTTTPVAIAGATIAAAAAPGALWVLSCVRDCAGEQPMVGQLSEVSDRTGQVIKRFPVLDAGSLAIGSGAIWIAHPFSGALTRVDPQNGRTTATTRLVLPVRVSRRDRRFDPSSVSVGAGSVWVSSPAGLIAQVDQRTSRLVAMLPTPSELNTIVVGAAGTWVAEDLGGLGFAAPGAHRLHVRQVSVDGGQQLDVTALVAGGGLIWAYASGPVAGPSYIGWRNISAVMAINPRTQQTVQTWQFAGANDTIAYAQGAAYVSDFTHGKLLRITPHHRIQPLHSRPGPDAIVAATPGALWAKTARGALLRLTLPGSKTH